MDDLAKREEQILLEKQLADQQLKQLKSQYQQLRKNDFLQQFNKPLVVQEDSQPLLQTKKNFEEGNLIKQIDRANAVVEKRRVDRIRQLKGKIEARQKQYKEMTEKTQALEKQRDRLEEILQAKNKVIESMGQKGNILSQDSKILIGEVKKTYERYEAQKKNYDRINERKAAVTLEGNKFNFEIQRITAQIEKVMADSLKKEQKCQKAQFELSQYKKQNKDKLVVATQEEDGLRKGNQKLLTENKRLERQKQELLQTYRKIDKMINLLQKQKHHLQLLGSLDMSEKEFMKAVDIGD